MLHIDRFAMETFEIRADEWPLLPNRVRRRLRKEARRVRTARKVRAREAA